FRRNSKCEHSLRLVDRVLHFLSTCTRESCESYRVDRTGWVEPEADLGTCCQPQVFATRIGHIQVARTLYAASFCACIFDRAHPCRHVRRPDRSPCAPSAPALGPSGG